jgi:23S rRNA (guanosine2251-2'-O)-methyltransferase
MNGTGYEIRQCQQPECGFRFPARVGTHRAGWCPRCGAPTRTAGILSAEDQIVPSALPEGPLLEAVLDNLRSAYNVGAILRTADGCGLRRVHLCGVTPTPDNPKVAKTGLGAQTWLPWVKHLDTISAVEAAKARGLAIWALEGGPRSVSLFEPIQTLPEQIALVVGSEVSGVDPAVIERCDRVVYIPMVGIKGSLNVAVAFGIAAYAIRFALSAPHDARKEKDQAA